MDRNRLVIFAAATLSATLWAYACGDGTTEPPPPPPDAPRPTTVTVSPATAELTARGATVQLSAEVRDQNGQVLAGATVAWTSDNAPVATVDGSGLVTAVAEGATTITATAGDARGTAEITVQNPDRAALEALYNATDGPNWRRNDNWLTDAPLADWYGVETDGSGRVESLVLGGRPADGLFNGLRGVIPPELGTLTNLKRLQLGKNGLSGAVPPELGNLISLEELYINNNLLTGPVPAELGNLHKLRILDLSHNEVTGLIPPELGNLPNLRVLNLWENALTGSIPPGLGKPRRTDRVEPDRQRTFRRNPACTWKPHQPEILVGLVQRPHGPDPAGTRQAGSVGDPQSPTQRPGRPDPAGTRQPGQFVVAMVGHERPHGHNPAGLGKLGQTGAIEFGFEPPYGPDPAGTWESPCLGVPQRFRQSVEWSDTTGTWNAHRTAGPVSERKPADRFPAAELSRTGKVDHARMPER